MSDADAETKPTKGDVRGRIRDQKMAMIQDEILNAASRLIAERGFRAVTVDDISSEMGFTKSIVYYYLKNKNEILWKLFQKIDETYALGLETALAENGTPTEMLANVVRMHCSNVLSHQEWSKIYNRDENELLPAQQKIVAANKHAYNRQIQQLYTRGVEAKEFQAIPPAIAVSCLLGACNWAYTWFKKGGRYSAETIASAYTNQLIHGVTSVRAK